MGIEAGVGRCLGFSKSLWRKQRLPRFRAPKRSLLASQVQGTHHNPKRQKKSTRGGADTSAPPSNPGVAGAGVQGTWDSGSTLWAPGDLWCTWVFCSVGVSQCLWLLLQFSVFSIIYTCQIYSRSGEKS